MSLANFLFLVIVFFGRSRLQLFLLVALLFFVGLYLLEQVVIRRGKSVIRLTRSILHSVIEAIRTNPDVTRITQRHPLLFGFLGNRLSTRQFTGLPLTVLILIFIYALSLFFGFAEDLVRQEPTLGIDTRLANLLVIFRHPSLVTAFLWITVLGTWQVVSVFMIVAVISMWRKGRTQYIIPLIITVLGSQIITDLSKFAIQRPRPSGLIPAYIEHSFSFPSSHATVAVAFYGFMTYYVYRQLKRWRWKVNAFFVGLIFILAIGFSRLYLGVHFASDVISGYLVGLLWLIVGISIIEWRQQRSPIIRLNEIPTKMRYSVLPIAMIWYILFGIWYVPKVDRLSVNETTPGHVVTEDNITTAFTTYSLPRFTETLAGNPQEPPSFIVIAADDDQLVKTFAQAGWQLADQLTLQSLYRMTHAVAWKESYPQAPMTPSFWESNVHNFGFEKQTPLNVVTERHHARFWKTSLLTPDGEHVYIGTASYDTSLKWFVTHKIEPAIDTERDHLLADLEQTGAVTHVEETQFVPPTLGRNFSGDQFFTDGKTYIVQLRP